MRSLLVCLSLLVVASVHEAHARPQPARPAPHSKTWHALPPQLQVHFSRQIQYRTYPFQRTAFRVRATRGFVRLPATSIVPRRELTPTLAYQWDVLASGGEFVGAPLPSTAPFMHNGEVDLLLYGRELRRAVGMRVARDELGRMMMEQSVDGGTFEARVSKVNADRNYRFPDSLKGMTLAERNRTGVYMSLGFYHRHARSPKLIRQAADDLIKWGVHAQVADLAPAGTTHQNAVLLRELLDSDLENVDRAMLVAFSKGGSDLVTFLLEEGSKMTAVQRAKIKVVVCMSGVLRGSFFADWTTEEPGMTARVMQLFMNIRGRGLFTPFTDLRSIAKSPWDADSGERIRELFPELLWINFPALPAGPVAETTSDPVFKLLGRLAVSGELEVGPHDGVVESAAGILPPGTGIPQWIVRTYSSHAILDGEFSNGGAVAPSYFGDEQLSAGTELMDQLMRALPRSAIDLP